MTKSQHIICCIVAEMALAFSVITLIAPKWMDDLPINKGNPMPDCYGKMPIIDRSKYENITSYRDLIFSIKGVQNAGLWRGCYKTKNKDNKMVDECKPLGSPNWLIIVRVLRITEAGFILTGTVFLILSLAKICKPYLICGLIACFTGGVFGLSGIAVLGSNADMYSGWSYCHDLGYGSWITAWLAALIALKINNVAHFQVLEQKTVVEQAEKAEKEKRPIKVITKSYHPVPNPR